MAIPFYPEIQKAFFDYYDLRPHMNNGGSIMSNYPKILTMIIGSTFENVVSNCIDNFLDYPITTPTINIPSFRDDNGFTKGGNAYKLFHTLRKNPSDPEYNATPFYQKFGINFRRMVEHEFISLQQDFRNRLAVEEPNIEATYQSNKNRYEVEYEDFLYMQEETAIPFSLAEQHMMMIKKQRNKVAHNFVECFPLSVDELRQYYYRSMIYVKSLENVFISQTKAYISNATIYK